MTRQPTKQENYKNMDKALISDLTWRTLDMQRSAFPNMHHYIAPDEIQHLLRVTTRKNYYRIHVVSLAVISDNEKDFREFISLAKERKCTIVSLEENEEFNVNGNCEKLILRWKEARRLGASKAGGSISAANREKDSKAKCSIIKDRWPLSNKEWRTPELLQEVDISYNTAIKYLGKRPIVQYNYQAKMKRKARNAK